MGENENKKTGLGPGGARHEAQNEVLALAKLTATAAAAGARPRDRPARRAIVGQWPPPQPPPPPTAALLVHTATAHLGWVFQWRCWPHQSFIIGHHPCPVPSVVGA